MEILVARKGNVTIAASRNVKFLLEHLQIEFGEGVPNYDAIAYQKRKKKTKFKLGEFDFEFINVLIKETPLKGPNKKSPQ